MHNNLAFTRACLAALCENTPADPRYELILVDNASTDGTTAYLRSLPIPVQVLSNDSNVGFSRACNRGAQAAQGEFLVFLNNDTVPFKGWLESLLRVASSDASIAIVGSKLLYPNGRVQHAGIGFAPRAPSHNILPFHNRRGGDPNAPQLNRQRDMQAVTAACMLVRRKIFFEAMGFDPAFVNGGEDVDLCLRIGQAGYRIVYSPTSVLVHHESVTAGRFLHDAENYRLLNERWKGKISPDWDLYLDCVSVWKEIPNYVDIDVIAEGVERIRAARNQSSWSRADRETLSSVYLALSRTYAGLGRRAEARRHLLSAVRCRTRSTFTVFSLLIALKAVVPVRPDFGGHTRLGRLVTAVARRASRLS